MSDAERATSTPPFADSGTSGSGGEHGTIPGSDRFTREEAPEHAWRLIATFAGRPASER